MIDRTARRFAPRISQLNPSWSWDKLTIETYSRQAEEGAQEVTQGTVEATGSRLRIRYPTTCWRCRAELPVGSSFRLRKIQGKMRTCHVRCP